MEDKSKKEELKEKFKRIYEKSKRVNLEKINFIYESIKQKQISTKKPSTASGISKEIGIKKNSVARYLKKLLDEKYIKKTREYPFVYLKVTDIEDEVAWVHTKDKREGRINEEVAKILSLIKSSKITFPAEILQGINFIQNNPKHDFKFLLEYNKIIDYFWKNFKSKDFFKLETGSGANRYLVV